MAIVWDYPGDDIIYSLGRLVFFILFFCDAGCLCDRGIDDGTEFIDRRYSHLPASRLYVGIFFPVGAGDRYAGTLICGYQNWR